MPNRPKTVRPVFPYHIPAVLPRYILSPASSVSSAKSLQISNRRSVRNVPSGRHPPASLYVFLTMLNILMTFSQEGLNRRAQLAAEMLLVRILCTCVTFVLSQRKRKLGISAEKNIRKKHFVLIFYDARCIIYVSWNLRSCGRVSSQRSGDGNHNRRYNFQRSIRFFAKEWKG